MDQCKVPVSQPEYSPPINYNSDLFGSQPSFNTEHNCDVQGGQYPYAEQDHLALRHLAFRSFVRPRTLDGKTVYKPVDEAQFSCDCNLSRTPMTAKYNNEALKFEVKSGVIKRGCDCIKRNGLQDRCPRVRHEGRWECLVGPPADKCRSEAVLRRPLYANHLQRPVRPPCSNPCASGRNLQGIADRCRSQGVLQRSFNATHMQGRTRPSCENTCASTCNLQRTPRSSYTQQHHRSQAMPGRVMDSRRAENSDCLPSKMSRSIQQYASSVQIARGSPYILCECTKLINEK